jgi:hypothetical protein
MQGRTPHRSLQGSTPILSCRTSESLDAFKRGMCVRALVRCSGATLRTPTQAPMPATMAEWQATGHHGSGQPSSGGMGQRRVDEGGADCTRGLPRIGPARVRLSPKRLSTDTRCRSSR